MALSAMGLSACDSDLLSPDDPMAPQGDVLGAEAFGLASDTLEQFSAKCDAEIGVTVKDFDCDAGTLVPTEHLTNHSDGTVTCDRPNRLDQVCDPGSKFQVLASTDEAYVVAHCRKKNNGTGKFGDIAVIQHNKKNGATCFYQAYKSGLSGKVKAPSKGTGAYDWQTPKETAAMGCVGCHDNGPLIRSPYLSQVKGANKLPGAGDASFNRDQPYRFVGNDFASWKVFKVEIAGNTCNGCHRMGVSNVRPGSGTSEDLGLRATAKSEASKNPHSADSPIWMTPGAVTYNAANRSAAESIAACAKKFRANQSLPAGCKVTEYGTSSVPPQILGVGSTNYALWGKSSLAAPWSSISNSEGIMDVTVLADGTLLGVGNTSFSLFTKSCLTCAWKSVDNSAGVRSVAVMKNGTLLGVGNTSFSLFTKSCLTCAWKSVDNSAGIRDVAVMPDGTILGVGNTNYALWTRQTLTSPWVSVPNSKGIQSVDVLANGTILGVGDTSFSLFTRASLGSAWVSVPSSAGVRAVAAVNKPVVVSSPSLPSHLATGFLDYANDQGVSGWATDPDHPEQAVTVHAYVDGVFVASGVADQFRADVGAHGYSFPVDVLARGRGDHQVVVYAIDLDGAGAPALANTPWTVNVTGGPAYGWLEEARTDEISGWTADPDHGGPLDVHIYIDGQFAAVVSAGLYRADVGAHGYYWDPPALAPGSHHVEVYAIGTDRLGRADGENPLLTGAPKDYYQWDFIKPGNNGTVSCSTFCEGAQWGEVGGCVDSQRSDTGERLGCFSAPGFLGSAQLTCECERGFIKPGNNGTVSCSTFCDGAQWGQVGRCVGAERSDTGQRLACSSVPGFLGSAQLTCQCVPKVILQ